MAVSELYNVRIAVFLRGDPSNRPSFHIPPNPETYPKDVAALPLLCFYLYNEHYHSIFLEDPHHHVPALLKRKEYHRVTPSKPASRAKKDSPSPDGRTEMVGMVKGKLAVVPLIPCGDNILRLRQSRLQAESRPDRTIPQLKIRSRHAKWRDQPEVLGPPLNEATTLRGKDRETLLCIDHPVQSCACVVC